jgi:hypothetical protein
MIRADRVREVTNTVGTGNYTLDGAPVGFRSFAECVPINSRCYYCATGGLNWEVGQGLLLSAGILSRERIIASSNNGQAVNWGPGQKSIFLTATAETQLPRINTAAAGPPSVSNNATQGYSQGSIWVSNAGIWVCLQTTNGNAPWIRLTEQNEFSVLAFNDISSLPASNPLTGTEQVPLVQGGITKRASVNAIGTAPIITTGGNTPRSLPDRFDDAVDVRDFGAIGDWDGNTGTDNTTAINNAFAYAATTKRMAIIPAPLPGKLGYYCANTVSLIGDAVGLHMVGVLYSPGNTIALLLGDGGTTKNGNKIYTNLSVIRTTISDWLSESDIGVRIRNSDACFISFGVTEGFTIGVQTYGDSRGFEDTTIILGRHVDHKVAVDVRTNTASAWNNSVRYIGGHLACQSTTNTSLDRYGFRFSNEPGGYNLHNTHTIFGTAFELQDHSGGGGGKAIPFYFQAEQGRSVMGYGLRSEGNNINLARVDGAWNDSVLEFSYVSPGGFNARVDYQPTATRNGVTLRVLHQAAAAHETLRLVLDVPNVRAVAYRDETTAVGAVGFEKLAVLTSNPSGPPTTLNGFCFASGTNFGLYNEHVQLPTSRAIAAVFPCDKTKEFFVAVEGDSLRLVILQFDANENLLGQAYPPTLSNANLMWNPNSTAYWWEMSANLDQLLNGQPVYRLQRVRAHADAAFIVIGVRGGDSAQPTNNKLRAFRIYTGANDFPNVIYGNGHSVGGVLQGRRWGSREWSDQHDWDFPAVGPGATLTQEFTANGCRQGDAVMISYRPSSGFQNGLLRYDAIPGGSSGNNTVLMFAENRSGNTINPAAGVMYIYGIRPRVPNT